MSNWSAMAMTMKTTTKTTTYHCH